MLFRIVRKKNPNEFRYPTEDVEIAKKFCNRLKEELKDFLKACVIFGSTARREATEKSDIDVLVVVDDISVSLTDEMIESYKLIIEHLIQEISLKLHVTSMTFTTFWEYVKAGDPIAINILRDGYPLYDTGFFEPLQILLHQGRIRPTKESVWAYFGRAPRTLINARWHLLQATVDLYWAVIDAAHSALMAIGEIPPTPEHVPELLEKKLVKKKLLEEKYVKIMKEFYVIAKKIIHRETREVTGEQFDKYLKKARDFVNRMKLLIEKVISV